MFRNNDLSVLTGYILDISTLSNAKPFPNKDKAPNSCETQIIKALSLGKPRRTAASGRSGTTGTHRILVQLRSLN
jgi:hypothetical protein